MNRDLSRLLRPECIAVVGGGTWCANVIGALQGFGFEGPIWEVHPSRAGAFAEVGALPGVPDAVFLGINRAATVEVVAALSAMGAGGAVCFASGFSEAVAELADGADLQDALLAAAGDMPILGPNCYGFVNGLDQVALWPDQHGMVPVEHGVAIVTQSSNIALNLTMQARGLPIAYLMTAGNQAQCDLAEIGMAVLADDRVTALGLHIEGIGDLRRFETLAAAARDAGKPIVALKVGASEQAQAATVSHTASLAGSDAGARALLARLGIGQVESVTALLEALKLLHVTGPLTSNHVASFSCSGGEASLMADTALGHDVVFPTLSAAQETGLRAALGPKVALANPLDYHTYIWGDRAAMAATFAAMMGGDLAIGCVVLDFPRPDRCDHGAWDIVIEAIADAQTTCGRPIAILASLPEALPEAVAMECMARGIPSLSGMDDALAAIAVAAKVGRAAPAPLLVPGGASGPVEMLDEAAAKAALAAHGLCVPRAERADRGEVAAAAARIGGTVVLKGTGLAHKTEAGAVVLGLTADSIEGAAAAMPGETFLVEEQVTGAVADLLIGVVRDPAHGFVLTLGAGGVWTEIMADVTHLLLPVAEAEIDAALERLRMAPLLDGYRGAAPADRGAIVRAVLAVQDYVAAHQTRIVEVEINPLLCTPTGAVAADALIRLTED